MMVPRRTRITVVLMLRTISNARRRMITISIPMFRIIISMPNHRIMIIRTHMIVLSLVLVLVV